MDTLEERFWTKVKRRAPDECWPTSATPSQRYGTLWVEGVGIQGIHRVAFFLKHGRWPNVGRHSCDNKRCANWDHVLDGTHADNSRDAVERGRVHGNGFKDWTHCKHGHEFTPENTYRPPNDQRACRACRNERSRQRRKKVTEQRLAKKAAQTRCHRGHTWAETARWQRHPNGKKYRVCRACATKRGRERRRMAKT